MLFKTGDMFEMSGRQQYKVLFATEEYFICCPVGKIMARNGVFVDIGSPKTYSNKGSLLEKDWIQKIDTYDCIYLKVKEL